LKEVLLIPVGNIEEGILKEIASAAEKAFPFRAEMGHPVDIPENAFNAKRQQYHSTLIIEALSRLKDHGSDLILGIVDKDLYVPQLNFVFGEADIRRGIAIISLFRLRQEFYRLRPDSRLFIERAIKEAIHEIGHLCGLEHCHEKRCIMYFSNTIRDTDIKGPGFCKSCLKRLGYID
jgi:archaemetzincin